MMPPADTSVQTLVLWAMAALTLVNLASILWTIFSSPAKAAAKRVDELAGRTDAQEFRIVSLEQAQRALPSSTDLHELELAMSELKGEMKAMSAVIRGQSDIMVRLEGIVGRHEQHLLEGKR